jgi:hypothetical protein
LKKRQPATVEVELEALPVIDRPSLEDQSVELYCSPSLAPATIGADSERIDSMSR